MTDRRQSSFRFFLLAAVLSAFLGAVYAVYRYAVSTQRLYDLCQAATAGDAAHTRALLERGGLIQGHLDAAMFHAARCNQPETLDLLLRSGANVNWRYRADVNTTALHRASLSWPDRGCPGAAAARRGARKCSGG